MRKTATYLSMFVVGLTTHFGSKMAIADIVLSEFLASNSGAQLNDEDGASSDWIEIVNTGITTMNLSGYHLTDDAADSTKWAFPARDLVAGERLVIFASSKDRASLSGELHTNFKLSAGGEYLALLGPGNTVETEYAPMFPAQISDVSYGIGTDGMTLGFFNPPTPGQANGGFAPGDVEDTDFSVTRGLYETPFSLTINTQTVGAEIRYTLDGSAPTATTGTVYSGPISISETTVVRAAAFKSGLTPTNVDTHTYLFPDDIRTQYGDGSTPTAWPPGGVNGQLYDYAMDPEITANFTAQEMVDALKAIPSVAMTISQDDFTSGANGINSNPDMRGFAWERAGHLEILDSQPGALQVAARCGFRIRGGVSRGKNNPKHAFRVFFRDIYGQSSFRYPLFGPEGVDDFEKFDLRTAQNYAWSFQGNKAYHTFLREVLARDLQAETGQPYTRSRFYHLYINGIYWGLYMTQERSEAEHGSRYLGGSSADYDTLKSGGNSQGHDTEATDGELSGDWQTLWDLTRAQNLGTNPNAYNEMQGLDATGARDLSKPVLLDVDNLIDFMLIIGYMGAYDSGLSDFIGASNNWYGIRNRVSDDRGFSFFVHDVEHSMGAGVGTRWADANDRINTTNGSALRDSFSKSNPQFMHIDLAESTPEYRLRFADRAHAALFNGGYLTTDKVLATLEKRRQIVDQVIIAESARWGDSKNTVPATRQDWINATNSLITTIQGRNAVFLGHLRAGSLYPNTDAPSLVPFGGKLVSGETFRINASSGTVYYTMDGSDPRLANGSPNPAATSFVSSGTISQFFINKNATWQYLDDGVGQGSSDLVVGAPGYSSSNWKHPDFNDDSWKSGLGILGHGALGLSGNVLPIATTIGLASGGGSKPVTSYLRHGFTVVNASNVISLEASVLADDGVVIYLNGVEVHRQNLVGGAIDHTEEAINAVGNADEIVYTPFAISSSLLVDGSNTLAVELHQSGSTSSDLGFDLDLEATLLGGQTQVITGPAFVQARALDGGEWSALTSAYFTTGEPVSPGDLVISELHYHPRTPSGAELTVSDDKGDYEFIELTNISSKTLELQGIELAEQVINDHLEGVRFILEDGALLPPGAQVIIASNRSAFVARYPTVSSSSVIGEYQGGMGNSGEWLQLKNAEGLVLASFRYNDKSPWPTAPDGGGYSLEVIQPLTNPDPANSQTWRASRGIEGTPDGEIKSFTFADWQVANFTPAQAAISGPNADPDNDGINNFSEFVLGSAPRDGTSQPDRPETGPMDIAGEDHLTFTYREWAGAQNVTYTVEVSNNLNGDWESGAAFLTEVGTPTDNGDGTTTRTFRVNQPIAQDPNQFVRLKVIGN